MNTEKIFKEETYSSTLTGNLLTLKCVNNEEFIINSFYYEQDYKIPKKAVRSLTDAKYGILEGIDILVYIYDKLDARYPFEDIAQAVAAVAAGYEKEELNDFFVYLCEGSLMAFLNATDKKQLFAEIWSEEHLD